MNRFIVIILISLDFNLNSAIRADDFCLCVPANARFVGTGLGFGLPFLPDLVCFGLSGRMPGPP